ncbi:MAG: GxxExxY protein [Gemmatimonadaceae bacterium]|nr:GxxExxY protein [Gemmatimonadaceae bacterium]
MSSANSLIELVTRIAIDVHKELGPSLLESTYEAIFVDELRLAGCQVATQVLLAVPYKGRVYQQAYRLDMLLENQLVVELKCTERVAPIHSRQVLTYLRCLKLRHGLVVNMGLERAIDGIDRVVNFRVPPEPGDS